MVAINGEVRGVKHFYWKLKKKKTHIISMYEIAFIILVQ